MKLKNSLPVIFLSLLLQTSCDFTPRKPVNENYDFHNGRHFIELPMGIGRQKAKPRDYNNDGIVDYLETSKQVVLAYDTAVMDSTFFKNNRIRIQHYTQREGKDYFQQVQKTIDAMEEFMFMNL